jgi:hypothetical protein
MKGQGVLAYWFDLVPECQLEWADWYIRDHMPSRLGATFTGARCFRAITGKPEFMALYETDSVEALVSPEYLTLLRNAPAGDRARRAWYKQTVRGTCRKLADVGHGQGGIVGTVRFSPRPGVTDANAVGAEIAEKLAKIERVGRVAFLEADAAVRATMDEARVTGHDDGVADKIMCIECSAEGYFQFCVDELVQMKAWTALANPQTTDIGCYRLLYAIGK